MNWSDIWTFVTGHWAIVVAPLTAVGAGVGWYLTYRGWAVARLNDSALEKEKYKNAVDLEKRKAELAFVSDQIRYLYGPLTALCETRKAAFGALMRQLAPNRSSFFDDDKRTPEELRQWRLWRTEVLMPLVLKMEELILQNAHLIEGTKIPAGFVDLMTHVAAYQVVIKNWTDTIESDSKAGTQEIVNQEHTSVINFPDEFRKDVGHMFKQLKARQVELIARTLDRPNAMQRVHPG